ncbi:MAG UNVERIFIED_CONTAM: hypothetical protein LVR29_06290 [Microcystis novacekii LVE1205-3]
MSQTKKEPVEGYLALAKYRILVTPEIIKKAKELTNFNFKNFAVFISLVLRITQIFSTTDDSLFKKYYLVRTK